MKEETLILTQADPVLFYGINNANFRLLRVLFPKVRITARGNIVKVTGEAAEVDECMARMADIERHIARFNTISDATIIELVKGGKPEAPEADNLILFGQNGKPVTARTEHQRQLVEAFGRDDLTIAVGPAGSGKTYTAIALAVRALKAKQARRVILCRPAVEAGEKLGFLPGDMKEKIDPYLQPLYDALEDMIPPFKLKEYMENGTIQIAPLAFMRGRTLADAVVILDEAQNTTPAQFKMFLTRLGFNSKMIVTGDDTQIDLPRGVPSGLVQGYGVIQGVKGVSLIRFDKKDIVRHPLVSRIVDAYDAYEARREPRQDS